MFILQLTCGCNNSIYIKVKPSLWFKGLDWGEQGRAKEILEVMKHTTPQFHEVRDWKTEVQQNINGSTPRLAAKGLLTINSILTMIWTYKGKQRKYLEEMIMFHVYVKRKQVVKYSFLITIPPKHMHVTHTTTTRPGNLAPHTHTNKHILFQESLPSLYACIMCRINVCRGILKELIAVERKMDHRMICPLKFPGRPVKHMAQKSKN